MENRKYSLARMILRSIELKPYRPNEIVIDTNKELLDFMADNSEIVRTLKLGAVGVAVNSRDESNVFINRMLKG